MTSDQLVNEYFNDDSKIILCQLEQAFSGCEDVEDIYKLAMCYLVEETLCAPENKSGIWGDMIKLVDDLD